MTTTNTIPATRNEAWGFWGTMNEHAGAAWPVAMTAISNATGQPFESVLAFLDSRHGRHFADEVHDGLFRGLTLARAIDAATQPPSAGWAGRLTARPANSTPSRAACLT